VHHYLSVKKNIMIKIFSLHLAIVLVLTQFTYAHVSTTVFAEDIVAVNDGLWLDPSTWDGLQVPNVLDDVTIPAGVNVTIAGSISAKTITVNGVLRAAGDASVSLQTEWVMVMGENALLEVGTPMTPFPSEFTFTLTLLDFSVGAATAMGEKFLGAMNGGRIELHGAPKVSWTRLGTNVFSGNSQITLANPVDWNQGDEVVVVSSRINGAEAEQRTVELISLDGLTLLLNEPLEFPHLGALETYTRSTDGKTWTADMRAEVGVLTHNVKVQGNGASEITGFGGHIMIMPTSTGNASHIELYRMGQKGELARYPWHWHLLHESGLGQSFRHSSVHRSFNRAITIHGTSYVEVEGNFFYDHIGHGVFLEDGSERFNIIRDNVVVLSKRPLAGEQVTISDNQFDEIQNRTPSSYWITNPNNIFEGNVAAGTEGTGFWFALPQLPMGASAGNPLFNGIEPYKEPLGSFSGNTAHSCRSGFDIFDQLFPDHSIRKNAGWQNSEEHLIEGCTWYSNDLAIYSGIGATVGDKVTYTANLKFLDNVFVANNTAMQLASYSQVIESAIVARDQEGYFDGMASLYRIYDGAGQVRNCHLIGWNHPNSDYLKDGGAGTKHTSHRISGITTDDGFSPRVDMLNYDRPASNTNTTPQSLSHPRVWNMVLLDEDGSFTGTPGNSVVSNHPMMLVGDEDQPSNWVNAFSSPHKFDLTILEFPSLDQEDIPNVTCTRTKTDTPTESVYYIYGYKDHIQLPFIVNEGFLYTYQFDSLPSTKQVSVVLDDADLGDDVLIQFLDFGQLGGLEISSTDWTFTEVQSFEDLSSSIGASFFNEPGGDVYFHLVAHQRLQFVTMTWNDDVSLPPLDTDGDGVTDLQEILAGTDPFVPYYGCLGDLNNNGAIDVEDVLILLSEFGCTQGCTGADLDADGSVVVGDLLLMLGLFGQPCNVAMPSVSLD
jgi:hypothetical protein